MKKLFQVAALMVAGIVLASCTSNIDVFAKNDGTLFVKYNAHFGNAFVEMAKSLSGDTNAKLFDVAGIATQFHNAGLKDASVVSKTDQDLAMSASVPKDFPNKAFSNFTNFTEEKDPSGKTNKVKKTASISFSPEKFQALYEALPNEMQSYIDLFMIPSFTGDSMSANEYKDLLASVYGERVANEIANAKLKISLTGPTGTKANQKFTLDLLELLTLATEKEFAIEW